jgi:biopolymer transport protein ExbB/TolQ
MSQTPLINKKVRFSWYRDDIESKLGLRGAQFTGVSTVLWLIVGAMTAAGFYGMLLLVPDSYISAVFTERGVFQYITVFIACWAIWNVLIKWTKIRVQNKALSFKDIVPAEADFVLSPATVGHVLNRLRQDCDDPSRFILFRRIELALANLKNIGQVADMDNVLESLAGNDEDVMESSYTLLKGLIWAIPVLGFIGTVQGLSAAIGKFGGVLGDAKDMSKLIPVLQGVTSGLSTAFDTTFVALLAALSIHLLLVIVRKSEEEMMNEARTYCQQHLVGRLRLTAYEGVV